MVLQLSGAAILWRSELQSITARSVFESELIALYVATADIIWISDLYEFYTGNALNIPTYIDNEDVVTRSQDHFNSPRLMLRRVAGLNLKREFPVVSIVNLKKGSI